MGYSQAAEIYANLKDGETIKLATHSMGGAYGKGFEKGLKKYAKENKLDARIERVLDLATFQGSKLALAQASRPFLKRNKLPLFSGGFILQNG